MTPSEFEKIKNEIKEIELSSASSEGKIETIENNWEKKYGFRTLEEAKKKRDEINKDIAEKTETRNKLMEQLESSYNWKSI